ncbi:unnamed protein product, partial [marine sediment metagenome]
GFERWISLTVLITSMISGEMANQLILGTTENKFLISVAWIIVLLFYLSMTILLFKILINLMLKKEFKIEKT